MTRVCVYVQIMSTFIGDLTTCKNRVSQLFMALVITLSCSIEFYLFKAPFVRISICIFSIGT